MPRGHLKHNKAVSKKMSLGGGRKKSHKNEHEKNEALANRRMYYDEIHDEINDYTYWNDDIDDFHSMYNEEPSISDMTCSIGTKRLNQQEEQECPICCEIRILVKLTKGCAHFPVCKECLREMYINQAQQDVKNYPLKCYHPSCERVVTHAQLQKHGFCRSDNDMTKHHRLSVLAKAYRGTMAITHCPHCDFPQEIKHHETVLCKSCRNKYVVVIENRSTEAHTIYTIENIKHDRAGINDGWARCPRCRIVISKGSGCDHMTCVCGHHFSWEFALGIVKKKMTPVMKAAKVERLEQEHAEKQTERVGRFPPS